MSIVDNARESQLQGLQSWSHRGLRRLGRGARSALTRRSERLAATATQNVASLGALLADPELLRWGAALTHSAFTLCERALDAEYLRAHLGGGLQRMITGAVRKLTAATLPREREPQPTRATVAPPFVCDRALVESMLL